MNLKRIAGEMAGTTTVFPPIPESAPSLPEYKAGDRVRFDTRVTGGTHSAKILRSRYSPFFGEWLYDIAITSDRSALYPRGHREYGVSQRSLRHPVAK